MQLSVKEQKRRQHCKELNSLRNKMGSNIVWFDSLSKTQQYDLLFGWKKLKKRNTKTKPEFVSRVKKVPIDETRPWILVHAPMGGRKKMIRVNELSYPPSLKHFIKEAQSNGLFQPRVQNIRQTTIDLLLEKK